VRGDQDATSAPFIVGGRSARTLSTWGRLNLITGVVWLLLGERGQGKDVFKKTLLGENGGTGV